MIIKQSIWITDSADETRKLGERIGDVLPEGIVIRLMGDLGSGKTVLVQGIARGLEVPPEYSITSPTFTLINEYPGRHTLFHVDLYRLTGAVDFEDIGLLDILYEEGVVVIEWAEKLEDEPEDQLSIHMEILSEQKRRVLMIAGGEKSATLLRGIGQRA